MARKKAEEVETPKYQLLLESIQETYGEEAAVVLESAGRFLPEGRRIGTGSIAMDIKMGTGGWPRGRIIELSGDESCGKTTLCLLAVVEAQKAGEAVMYVDAEEGLDPKYMAQIGVKVEELVIAKPNHLQQALDMIYDTAVAGTAAMIVVDSLPALPPKEVLEGSAEDQTRGLVARYLSSQLPKIVHAIAESNTMVMIINQTRDSMSTSPYAPSKTTPGGRALKFFSSVRCEMWRQLEGKREDGIEYQDINWNLIKNKVGIPYRKGQIRLIPLNEDAGPQALVGMDYVHDILETAADFGLLQEGKVEDGEFYERKQWWTMTMPGTGEIIQAYNWRPFRSMFEPGGEYHSYLDTIKESIYALTIPAEVDEEADEDADEEAAGLTAVS